MPFIDSLDIANRAAQLLGVTQIASVTEVSKNNRQLANAYDKTRRVELRRNAWRFAIKKAVLRAVDTTTMILRPSAYDAAVTYLPGSIVADSNGLLWSSMEPDNINNSPGGNNDKWDMYFGPMTVHEYDSTTAYFAGEIVYKAGAAAGSYAVYMSLGNSNDDEPDTATAYDATVTYYADQVVSSGGSQWRCLIPFVVGVTPADGPAAYDNTATYAAAQTVTGSDNFIYSSVAGSNTGHDPVTDAGIHWTNTNVAHAWSRTPTIGVSSVNWRVIAATITPLSFAYPIGCGPSSQSSTRNVFRLPSGFLREASQNPKSRGGALGGPSGIAYDDWEKDGNFIVSDDTGPIVLRFVADFVKVSEMDDMFCEGLACRIATATCEALTQSSEKLQAIASQYKLFMGEAKTVNAIEQGSDEPPDDEYISVRA